MKYRGKKIDYWQFKKKCEDLALLFKSEYMQTQMDHLYNKELFYLLDEKQIDDICTRLARRCHRLPTIADWIADGLTEVTDARKASLKQLERQMEKKGDTCVWCNYNGFVNAKVIDSGYECYFRCSKCEAQDLRELSHAIPLWDNKFLSKVRIHRHFRPDHKDDPEHQRLKAIFREHGWKTMISEMKISC